jgi:hypothetical protein
MHSLATICAGLCFCWTLPGISWLEALCADQQKAGTVAPLRPGPSGPGSGNRLCLGPVHFLTEAVDHRVDTSLIQELWTGHLLGSKGDRRRKSRRDPKSFAPVKESEGGNRKR